MYPSTSVIVDRYFFASGMARISAALIPSGVNQVAMSVFVLTNSHSTAPGLVLTIIQSFGVIGVGDECQIVIRSRPQRYIFVNINGKYNMMLSEYR